MSANTDYSQMIPFMSVFNNPIHRTKCAPICITFQFTKLNICQMYRVAIYTVCFLILGDLNSVQITTESYNLQQYNDFDYDS